MSDCPEHLPALFSKCFASTSTNLYAGSFLNVDNLRARVLSTCPSCAGLNVFVGQDGVVFKKYQESIVVRQRRRS